MKTANEVALEAELAKLRDEVARLNGIPQCSFCHKRSIGTCGQRRCNHAPVCGDHGTIMGMTSFHGTNPKNNTLLHHVLCDRCNGEKTSETAGLQRERTPDE